MFYYRLSLFTSYWFIRFITSLFTGCKGLANTSNVIAAAILLTTKKSPAIGQIL